MYLRISRAKFRSWAIKTAAIVAVAVIVARLFLVPTATNAAWYDDNYAYRQKVTIGNSGSADANKKIKLDVDTATLITAGKMRSDCADTRFTDGSGKPLKYYIDAANGADGGDEFNGDIDEVKIYRYALNADDVKTEYNQGKSQVMGALSTTSTGLSADNSASREYCVPGESSGTCSYPLNQWSFDEGAGTLGYDIGSSPINANLANGTSWAVGKVGKAVNFDGCSYRTTSGVI